jgi:hypothetical protein
MPTQISLDTNWKSISGGNNHSLAIKQDGTLWAWGLNFYGELGDGTNAEKYIPTHIGVATNWQSLSAGIHHSLAIKQDGTLWAWGYNNEGRLGDGTQLDKNVPTLIGITSNWVSVSGGSTHSFAVRQDGTLWSWGQNFYGSLGDGTNVNHYMPAIINTLNCSPSYIHNISDGKIILYPNPFTNELSVYGLYQNEDIKYEIANSLGQIIQSGIFYFNSPVQVSTLKKGIYFIKLENKVFKLIKE